MAYVVGTCTAAFCRGEDHPRGVPVPTGGVPAGRAPEDALAQPGARLSLATLRAGHCRVSGLDQHHLPASPHPAFDQFPLRSANGRIGGFACHRGPAEELRAEVFYGDQLVVIHDRRAQRRAAGVLPGRL